MLPCRKSIQGTAGLRCIKGSGRAVRLDIGLEAFGEAIQWLACKLKGVDHMRAALLFFAFFLWWGSASRGFPRLNMLSARMEARQRTLWMITKLMEGIKYDMSRKGLCLNMEGRDPSCLMQVAFDICMFCSVHLFALRKNQLTGPSKRATIWLAYMFRQQQNVMATVHLRVVKMLSRHELLSTGMKCYWFSFRREFLRQL